LQPPTWIPLNEAAGLVFISTNSGKDFPEHPYRALELLLATLADGGLWAEGIKAGQEPPDYVRLSEAWWAGALIVPPRLRTVEPIGRTVVDFRAAISRRRTSRDVVVEYRSIRLLAEEFLKVHPRPDLNKIMHTFPELCRWTSMLGVRRGGVLITFDKSKRPAEAIPIFEVGEPSPSPSIREWMAAFDGPNERQPVRTEFAGRPSLELL
jgi:hypothetical protein